MSRFLEALGGKLAEQWISLLVLPGALFLVTTAAAVTLGQSRWYDVGLLRDWINSVTTPSTGQSGAAISSTGQGAATIALVAVTFAAGSAAVGMAARALGSGLERLWLTDSKSRLARHLTGRRQARWQEADDKFRAALLAAGRAQIAGDTQAAVHAERAEQFNAARNRVALSSPRRPFWLGDRIEAVEERVLTAYDLDLASTWPRLWLVLPESVRTELHTARAASSTATQVMAWGLGYLALGTVWWPAAVAGVCTVLTGWRRGRVAGAVLADLVEATVDLHGGDLAVALGFECPGPLTREVGMAVTEILRKQT